MDIEAVRGRKDRLESEIMRLLREFQIDTKTTVIAVHLTHFNINVGRMGEPTPRYPVSSGVEVEVRV